jgi:hypothetical protein
MRLNQLLSLILAKTPLIVSIPENDNRWFNSPETLFDSAIHPTIVRVVAHACVIAGFSERGAYAFGEFIAELITGWTTHFSNKADILALNAAFAEVAYGSSNKVIRIYLLPNWEALREHLPAIQRGVAAAFVLAKTLHVRKTEVQQEAEKSPSSRAIASIVLGILGLISGCGLLVFSPLAWYLGRKELKAIQAGLSPKSGEGYARVGVVLGIIGTTICVLLLLLYLAVGIYWFKTTPVSP